MAPWSERRSHEYVGLGYGRPYAVDLTPPPPWAHDLVRPPARRVPTRRRATGRTRLAVPALVLAALALPWTALALPAVGTAAGAGTAAPSGSSTDDAALASMLIGPSAPEPGLRTASSTATAPRPAGRLHAAGRPLEVVVPALDVTAPVRPISAVDGTLVPPSDATSAGWWREGPEPGAARGTAVITGHTVHTGGGAFDHLDRLRAGDTVLVRTTHGWVHYAVRAVSTYAKGRLAAQATSVFSPTGAGRLVLVTCSQFDGHEYLANTVVDAVPVS